MTEWRKIPGWPDYEVSDQGSVRRDGTVLTTNLHKGKRYLEVCLSANGRTKNYDIHVLVCMAFHGPKPSRLHHAAHWDGDNFHNDWANLRWATPAENTADRIRCGKRLLGEKNPNAKLSDDAVREIKTSWASVSNRYGSKAKAMKDLAAKYSVKPAAIESVVYNMRSTPIS